MKRKNFHLPSIGLFYKILLISFIGTVGIGILASITFHNASNTHKMVAYSQAGNNMSKQVLEIVLLENAFIDQADGQFVSKIEAKIKALEASLTAAREIDPASRINVVIGEVESLKASHRKVVDRLIPEAMGLKKTVERIGEHFSVA
ncbi:MAG: hypothetical protein JEZ11_24410, partial [Desulfobacterales bacterium]|nr:hypothetical protein [Desulfobacterales bacterium]